MTVDRTDGDAAAEPMVKIDCHVPAALLDAIDDASEERGYSTRSEAIRDALRDWLDPAVTLSPETLEALDGQVQNRVLRKLEEAAEWTERRLERLSGWNYYRRRIGDYRAIVTWGRAGDRLLVEVVGHRRNVYDQHLSP